MLCSECRLCATFYFLQGIKKYEASLDYKGVQLPTFDTQLFNLDLVTESETYCDEVKGI